MPSARKRSRRIRKSASSRSTRKWQDDASYVADQARESSWSSNSLWGDAAAAKFVKFGKWLGDRLCHDDTVADFGGNDGWAAYCFYLEHKIKPLVVDCEPQRLEHADKRFRLSTYQSFIEDMRELADDSIDWGFTSHTLEHTRDTAKALREIVRVIKRGCYFVLPLEDLRHARKNHAHAICFTKVGDWARLLEDNGWRVIVKERVTEYEAQMYAEPA
jgi:ubiquinone/menaquinone biosynthesis C-methylase UbiE